MSNKNTILIRYHYQGVEELFDDYAETFDEHLTTGLRYNVPTLMKEQLDMVEDMMSTQPIHEQEDQDRNTIKNSYSNGSNGSNGSNSSEKMPEASAEEKEIIQHNKNDDHEEKMPKYRRCLDLGCGTGLAGVVFRKDCQYMEGNDISRLMVKKAKARPGIYDLAVHNNLMNHLRKQADASFDLIISADVVMYLPDDDLNAMICAVYRVLEPGGMLVFSTEALIVENKDGDNDEEQHLTSQHFKRLESERYAHSRDYVLNIGEKIGLQIKNVKRARCRMDEGKEILGDIYIFQKPRA